MKTKQQIDNEIRRRVRAMHRAGEWQDDPNAAAGLIALKMREFDVSKTRVLTIARRILKPPKILTWRQRRANRRRAVRVYIKDETQAIGCGWRFVTVDKVTHHGARVTVIHPDTGGKFTLPRDLFVDHEPVEDLVRS